MIIEAALLVRVGETPTPIVVPCRRHGDGMAMLRDLFGGDRTKYVVIEQGFIDHNGQYFDRKSALSQAMICGQLNATTIYAKRRNKEDELYSEDLY